MILKKVTLGRLTLKVAVELLSGRIQQLSQFISDHSLEAPLMDAEQYDVLLRVLKYQRIPLSSLDEVLRQDTSSGSDGPAAEVISGGEAAFQPTDAMNATDWGEGFSLQFTSPGSDFATAAVADETTPCSGDGDPLGSSGVLPMPSSGRDWVQAVLDHDQLYPFQADGTTEMPQASPQSVLSGQPTTAIDDSAQYKNPYGDSDDNTEALIDQLSLRVGSLQIRPGGHARYYGPTSNFNLIRELVPNSADLNRTSLTDSREHLIRLGLGKQVPEGLEDHLVNLYFCWQNPALRVVDRDTYEAAKTKTGFWKDSRYYSESLRNAM